MDSRLTVKLTVFASGSGGNSCLVQSGGDSVLVDAGVSARRLCQSLDRAGTAPAALTAILVTHEHADHIKGLPVFLKKTPAPVFAPEAAAELLRRSIPGAAACIRAVVPGKAFSLGNLEVLAFPTPHDAAQSVGYRLTGADGAVLAVATDTGCVTETMVQGLSGADIALIEANHDEAMLRSGPYPPALKRRILSERGHLSNADCARLAGTLARQGARIVVLGHLSRQNNDPAVALKTVSAALTGTDTRLYAAPELGFLEVETAPCCV